MGIRGRTSLLGVSKPRSRERVLDWVLRRRRVALVAATAVLGLGVAVWGYASWGERLELQASAALAQAKAEGKAAAGASAQVLDRLGEVASSYPGTVAAEQAMLEIGDRLFAAGRYEEALQSFQAYLSGVRGGRFTVLAGLGKGYALEALGRHEEAAKVFESLAASREATGQILAAETLMGLARNQTKLGRFQEAKETYQRVRERYPGSSWAYVAERALIFLDR